MRLKYLFTTFAIKILLDILRDPLQSFIRFTVTKTNQLNACLNPICQLPCCFKYRLRSYRISGLFSIVIEIQNDLI